MATNKPGCVQQQNVLDLDTLSLPSVCQSCNLTKLACLCPIICDRDSNDPDKIWAILHYPDALKISHNMLCCLLKKLRNYQDDKVVHIFHG